MIANLRWKYSTIVERKIVEINSGNIIYITISTHKKTNYFACDVIYAKITDLWHTL